MKIKVFLEPSSARARHASPGAPNNTFHHFFAVCALFKYWTTFIYHPAMPCDACELVAFLLIYISRHLLCMPSLLYSIGHFLIFPHTLYHLLYSLVTDVSHVSHHILSFPFRTYFTCYFQLEGMVNVLREACTRVGCQRTASYGFPGEVKESLAT